MKYLITSALIICALHGAEAAIWPGTDAPCNTTLNACANGSPAGEVIEIHTNGPIDESINANNGISLIAGAGYRPVFAAGRQIEMTGTSTSDLTVTYSGLTFVNGRISYRSLGFNGSSTSLNISNNRIENTTFNNESVRILHFGNVNGTHTLNLNIENNTIDFDTTGNNIERSGSIAITNGSSSGSASTGILSGQIFNNTIHVSGNESVGIGLYEYDENSSEINISSNTITGGDQAAMLIDKLAGATGSSQINFANNAIYNNNADPELRGLKSNIQDGQLQLNVINNSVIDAFEGFNFQQSFGGVYDINFYNNLIVSTRTSVIIRNPTTADADSNISFTNDYNFFYANSLADPDFTVGPNFITANPKITSFSNARLRPGSPAIEAGNQAALFLMAGVPIIDADGLHRLKNGNPGSGGITIDIGAYEAGDTHVTDYLRGGSSSINTIESPLITGQNFAKLQVIHNYSPEGLTANLTRNDASLGVFNQGEEWNIFNQNTQNMNDDTAFNVWNPAPSTHNFVHTASDATAPDESYTVIDVPSMNNNPDLVLSVTQLWRGVYNNNPVGIFYSPFNDKWHVYNTNFEDMPTGAEFNIYYQQKSSNAFIHRATESNISDDATYIDHPLLNNTACAQIHVTYDSGIVYPAHIGVFYDTGSERWGIYNEGSETMPELAKFHVMLSAEQIASCTDLIFRNGFE